MRRGKSTLFASHSCDNGPLHGMARPTLHGGCSLDAAFLAVNKYFRDHELHPIVVGDLRDDARRGLEMLQHRLVPADTRLPLPAPVALDIMLAANSFRDNLTWSPATLPLLERFRACMAVCVNYTFFCRAETCTRCLTRDRTVDRPSQQFVCSCASPKGTSAVTTATNSYWPSRSPPTPF
jgi:hypothetical protein